MLNSQQIESLAHQRQRELLETARRVRQSRRRDVGSRFWARHRRRRVADHTDAG